MHMDDFDEFAKIVTACAEIYSKSLSDGALQLWWSLLSNYDIQQIKIAIEKHIKNPETGMFMPKPADVAKHCEGTATDNAQIAWGKVFRAIKDYGHPQSVVFDDAAIHASIDDLGGWVKLCQSTEKEMDFLQNRFIKSYIAYSKRSDYEYPSVLLGSGACTDELYLSKGLTPPKPKYIGSHEKCKLIESKKNNQSAERMQPIKNLLINV